MKKALSLAIAAALAAPAVASAEAIVYGKLNVSLDYADVSNVIRNRVDPATGDLVLDANGVPVQVAEDFKGWGFSKGNGFIPGDGRGNRLGVKGSEDLGNGLKAVYQIELGINFDTNNNLANNADTVSYRNTFAGLAGNWGTLLAGRHDTPMKISTGKLDLFSDTMADFNGTVGFLDIRADTTIAYVSPNWSGFQLALATVPAGGATATGATNINSDQINGAYSLAAIFSNGPFYASLSNEMFMGTNSSLFGQAQCVPNPGQVTPVTCNYVDNDWTQWRLGLGLLNWNGFTLTAIYANQDDIPAGQTFIASGPGVPGNQAFFLPGGSNSVEQWQIQAGYTFGNFMIKGMYGQASYDSDTAIAGSLLDPARIQVLDDLYDGSRDTWAIGVDYNFSKRTTAYVLYTAVTDDQNDIPQFLGQSALPAPTRQDWDGFSIGLMHSF